MESQPYRGRSSLHLPQNVFLRINTTGRPAALPLSPSSTRLCLGRVSRAHAYTVALIRTTAAKAQLQACPFGREETSEMFPES